MQQDRTESVCMPVINRKFLPEALRNRPQITFYILLSKLF